LARCSVAAATEEEIEADGREDETEDAKAGIREGLALRIRQKAPRASRQTMDDTHRTVSA